MSLPEGISLVEYSGKLAIEVFSLRVSEARCVTIYFGGDLLHIPSDNEKVSWNHRTRNKGERKTLFTLSAREQDKVCEFILKMWEDKKELRDLKEKVAQLEKELDEN